MNKTVNLSISIIGIICAAIAVFLFEKKTKWEGSDERQILETFKSSTIGFYTLIVLNIISLVLIRDIELPFAPELLILISTAAAFTLSLIRDIWVDNIHSNQINMKFAFLFVSVFIILGTARYIKAYMNNAKIENLIIAVTFAAAYISVLITMLLKFIKVRNTKVEE
ncbi:MAG: hypothetical protein MJ185_10870 [Treponema sp.]|nr:hypothetical protein [Treponema sp.]